MNQFSIFGAMWWLSLALAPAVQVRQEKLSEIVSMLRLYWGPDFNSKYRTYMLGHPPPVVLIPREEMLRITAARLDGRQRDGSTTHGLTIGEKPDVKIVVVYDDIAPLFVAKAISHEIGHLELRDRRLSRNPEEAHVRKVVDTGFFERVFGRRWLETTVTLLKNKVIMVEKNRRLYQGYTPEAIEMFYLQLKKGGIEVEKTPLHDQIVAGVVFILTNSEESLSAALDADDDAIGR